MEHREPFKQIFDLTHTLNPKIGSIGQTIFFESSHVEYQIKGNEIQNIMQADILS